MRIVFLFLLSCFFVSSAAAAVIEFNEFADGTPISDQYEDFTVDLIGTDEEASIFFGTYLGGGEKTVLINNESIDSVGHNMLITFESVVEDVVIEYTAVNFAGGAEVTTESGTTFQEMQSAGCRTSLCVADFSSYGSISSLFFIFEDEEFEEVWSIERMSYSLVGGSTGGDRPSPVPLPSSGFLLLGAICGGAWLRGRRERTL